MRKILRCDNLVLCASLLMIVSLNQASSACLLCKGGALSIDKPFNKGGALSINKPLDKGGALSINKPLDKGGALSINKPLDKGGALSIDKPFDKGGALSVDKPFNGDIAKFVSKHPWETVAAVAFIAGGAYLIAYEGYSLEVAVGTKTVTLIAGGELTGGSSLAAGAGTLAYAALQPEGGPASTATPVAPAASAAPAQPSASSPKGTTAPQPTTSAEQKPKSIVELPVLEHPAPALDASATDVQKIDYAAQLLSWTHFYYPAEQFDPKQYPNTLSPVEINILKALVVLQDIPDSPADAAAKKQAEDRANTLLNDAKIAGEDLMKGKPEAIPYDVLKDILKKALEPTLVGDGQSAARWALANDLQDELAKYAYRRDPKLKPSLTDSWLRPQDLQNFQPPPQGPTIENARP